MISKRWESTRVFASCSSLSEDSLTPLQSRGTFKHILLYRVSAGNSNSQSGRIRCLFYRLRKWPALRKSANLTVRRFTTTSSRLLSWKATTKQVGLQSNTWQVHIQCCNTSWEVAFGAAFLTPSFSSHGSGHHHWHWCFSAHYYNCTVHELWLWDSSYDMVQLIKWVLSLGEGSSEANPLFPVATIHES